jgi:hypothetical protein
MGSLARTTGFGRGNRNGSESKDISTPTSLDLTCSLGHSRLGRTHQTEQELYQGTLTLATACRSNRLFLLPSPPAPQSVDHRHAYLRAQTVAAHTSMDGTSSSTASKRHREESSGSPDELVDAVHRLWLRGPQQSPPPPPEQEQHAPP